MVCHAGSLAIAASAASARNTHGVGRVTRGGTRAGIGASPERAAAGNESSGARHDGHAEPGQSAGASRPGASPCPAHCLGTETRNACCSQLTGVNHTAGSQCQPCAPDSRDHGTGHPCPHVRAPCGGGRGPSPPADDQPGSSHPTSHEPGHRGTFANSNAHQPGQRNDTPPDGAGHGAGRSGSTCRDRSHGVGHARHQPGDEPSHSFCTGYEPGRGPNRVPASGLVTNTSADGGHARTTASPQTGRRATAAGCPGCHHRSAGGGSCLGAWFRPGSPGGARDRDLFLGEQ